jgi:hypothetical protein
MKQLQQPIESIRETHILVTSLTCKDVYEMKHNTNTDSNLRKLNINLNVTICVDVRRQTNRHTFDVGLSHACIELQSRYFR